MTFLKNTNSIEKIMTIYQNCGIESASIKLNVSTTGHGNGFSTFVSEYLKEYLAFRLYFLHVCFFLSFFFLTYDSQNKNV